MEAEEKKAETETVLQNIEAMEEEPSDDDPTVADLQIFTEYDFLLDGEMTKKVEQLMKMINGRANGKSDDDTGAPSASVSRRLSSKAAVLLAPKKADTSKAAMLQYFQPRRAPK